jgi:hypothetical protein
MECPVCKQASTQNELFGMTLELSDVVHVQLGAAEARQRWLLGRLEGGADRVGPL